MDLSTEDVRPSRYKVAVQMKVTVQVNVKSKVTVKVTAPTSWPPALKALRAASGYFLDSVFFSDASPITTSGTRAGALIYKQKT